MKNLLSFLGIIILITNGSSGLIGCENNKNTNKNNVNDNKSKPKKNYPKNEKTQIPENSNWKLVENLGEFYESGKDKWFLYVLKSSLDEDFYYFVNLYNAGNPDEKEWKSGYQAALYRWDGNGKPQIPTINENTGKILKWNEKTD